MIVHCYVSSRLGRTVPLAVTPFMLDEGGCPILQLCLHLVSCLAFQPGHVRHAQYILFVSRVKHKSKSAKLIRYTSILYSEHTSPQEQVQLYTVSLAAWTSAKHWLVLARRQKGTVLPQTRELSWSSAPEQKVISHCLAWPVTHTRSRNADCSLCNVSAGTGSDELASPWRSMDAEVDVLSVPCRLPAWQHV